MLVLEVQGFWDARTSVPWQDVRRSRTQEYSVVLVHEQY